MLANSLLNPECLASVPHFVELDGVAQGIHALPLAGVRVHGKLPFCREPLLALEDDGLRRFLLDRLDAALAASLGTDPAVDGAQA